MTPKTIELLEPLVLEGDRVRLLPLERAHIPELLEIAGNPLIWSGGFHPLSSPELMEQYVEEALQQQQQGQGLPFAVYDKHHRRVVGSTRLFDYAPAHRQAEIGNTWYQPEVWRTSVNTECKLLLLRHAFDTLRLIRVQLKTDLRNLRSQAAILRLGAVKEGVLRQHRILPDGYVRDSVMFSVLDKEWPAVEQRLLGFLERG